LRFLIVLKPFLDWDIDNDLIIILMYKYKTKFRYTFSNFSFDSVNYSSIVWTHKCALPCKVLCL